MTCSNDLSGRWLAVPLCAAATGNPVPLTHAELETFIEGASPSEVAVMVSAKAGMKPAAYADVFERRWAASTESK